MDVDIKMYRLGRTAKRVKRTAAQHVLSVGILAGVAGGELAAVWGHYRCPGLKSLLAGVGSPACDRVRLRRGRLVHVKPWGSRDKQSRIAVPVAGAAFRHRRVRRRLAGQGWRQVSADRQGGGAEGSECGI